MKDAAVDQVKTEMKKSNVSEQDLHKELEKKDGADNSQATAANTLSMFGPLIGSFYPLIEDRVRDMAKASLKELPDKHVLVNIAQTLKMLDAPEAELKEQLVHTFSFGQEP